MFLLGLATLLMSTQARYTLKSPSALVTSQGFVLRDVSEDMGDEVTTNLAFIVAGPPTTLWVVMLCVSRLADVLLDDMVLKDGQICSKVCRKTDELT